MQQVINCKNILLEINSGSFAQFCHNTATLIQIGQQYRGTACLSVMWIVTQRLFTGAKKVPTEIVGENETHDTGPAHFFPKSHGFRDD